MHRRTLLEATVAAAGLGPNWIAGAFNRPAGPAQDEELLAAARMHIQQHRMADGVVLVQNASAQPVAGAEVEVEQVRHEFLFGSNLFRFGHIDDAEREVEYRERFANLLNYATLWFYWALFEPNRGHPQYAYVDDVVDWCRRQGIQPKGHPLAWQHAGSAPTWLPHDLREVESLSLGRVQECVRGFRNRIEKWDVVNEPSSNMRYDNPMGALFRQLGATEFTRRHLIAARAANPQATLIVNDKDPFPSFYAILDALRNSGTPLFDVIGMQSHMHGGVWTPRQIWDVCDFLGRLGMAVHFTETTIVSGAHLPQSQSWGPSTPEGEAKQADDVASFYTMLFGHPAVRAITWWDFTDDGAWQGAPAGLLRSDMSPKPAYERLQGLIKGQWWTRASGRTAANGEFAVRAFLGVHRIQVTSPSGGTTVLEGHWEKGADNRFVVSLA